MFKKLKAKILGIPYKKKVWYNYRAMLFADNLKDKSFIEIFDEDGNYIDCPNIGGTVIYNIEGRKYLYEIIDFENESRNKDWLYDSDYINPVIRFVKAL